MMTDPKKGDQTPVEEHRKKLGRVLVKCACGAESELEKERPKGGKAPLCGNCGQKLQPDTSDKGDKQ